MKILWISRHDMTDEQLTDLHRIYGNFELQKLDKTIQNVNDILQINADVYAVVLPLNILIELKENTSADIIQPVSERILSNRVVFNFANGKYEKEYIFKHMYWQKIIKADIEFKKL